MDSRYESTGHGSFTLERSNHWDPKTGELTWIGEGEAHGRGQGVFSQWDKISGTGDEWTQEFGGKQGQRRIEFTLLMDQDLPLGFPSSRCVG